MTRKILLLAGTFSAAIALAACNKDPAPPGTQYGANPQLPAPKQYVMPPMQVPK